MADRFAQSLDMFSAAIEQARQSLVRSFSDSLIEIIERFLDLFAIERSDFAGHGLIRQGRDALNLLVNTFRGYH